MSTALTSGCLYRSAEREEKYAAVDLRRQAPKSPRRVCTLGARGTRVRTPANDLQIWRTFRGWHSAGAHRETGGKFGEIIHGTNVLIYTFWNHTLFGHTIL